MAKWNLGWLGLAPKSWNKKASEFLTGKEAQQGQYFDKSQLPLYEQMQAALQGQGAGGAFGGAADYYRDLLSNDSQTYNQMIAPQMRQFNEEIIPGLSEQFAGMGSGGLSSSGFRNAAVNAGTDLSERLGAIRAQLRQQGAQGLQQMGQFGLGDFSTYQPGQAGLLQMAAPAAGAAIGAYAGGPAGAYAGYQAGNQMSNQASTMGKSNPYGMAAQGTQYGMNNRRGY